MLLGIFTVRHETIPTMIKGTGPFYCISLVTNPQFKIIATFETIEVQTNH